MSTISSVQSYGSPFFRPQAPLPTEVEVPPVQEVGRQAVSTAPGSTDRDVEDARGRSSSSERPSQPSSVASRIDDLIAGQVSSGTLTSDQAADLKTAFAPATPSGDAEGARDPGSPPPLPSSSSTSPDGVRAGQTDQTRDTSGSDRDALLDQFVQQLRQNVASGYSAGGAATKTARSLVFDISA